MYEKYRPKKHKPKKAREKWLKYETGSPQLLLYY
jgi:hypothetical protein